MTELERLMLLHDTAIASKDVDSMRTADGVFRKAVERLNEYSEDEIKELCETYDGELNYNNFLTEKEAKRIIEKIPVKWEADLFFQTCEGLGLATEKKPYFNRWALWAIANTIADDQSETIAKWTQNDKYQFVQMTHDLASSQLSDKDKPKFVRWYFGIG